MITTPTAATFEVRTYDRSGIEAAIPRWERFVDRTDARPLSYHPAWLAVLAEGLGHAPFCLEAVAGERTAGLLPLAFLNTRLFGRFLVGLPYLNYGGAMADDAPTALRLVDEALALADRLRVRFLELRHERAIDHPALRPHPARKVHMRLPLPPTAEGLWRRLSPKVRNQVRKGQKGGLRVAWGGVERFPEFYDVFSRNMRDLGTPVFGRRLFLSALRRFPDRAEICVVRAADRPVAAALLLHGRGVTEVPSAGSLREFNNTCANMMMYWCLLERAIRRGQEAFDFGRSTAESPVFKFKGQWGAVPTAAEWQCYNRDGSASEVRPDNPRYGRFIRIWKRLPVALTRGIGPLIVRGIP
jgi:FemAB-related protein (PEP-CTERM system-associated)